MSVRVEVSWDDRTTSAFEVNDADLDDLRITEDDIKANGMRWFWDQMMSAWGASEMYGLLRLNEVESGPPEVDEYEIYVTGSEGYDL